MKRPKRLEERDGYTEAIEQYCDELEDKYSELVDIEDMTRKDKEIIQKENEELRGAIDKMYVLCIGKHYDKVEDILNELSTKTEIKMKFDLLNIEYEPKGWFWLTIASIEWGDQCRSLLHIERNQGMWKFQLLWLANDCWIVE
jgi:hypothetical protein